MPLINLREAAMALPEAWRSKVIDRPGASNFKVLRMDDAAYLDETHDFVEALLVIDGQMNLTMDGQTHAVRAGEVFFVPAGTPHAVAPGSSGTLVIVDV